MIKTYSNQTLLFDRDGQRFAVASESRCASCAAGGLAPALARGLALRPRGAPRTHPDRALKRI